MQIKTFLGLSLTGFHKISYTHWGAVSSSMPPVVCVHGLVRNGRDFDRLADTLQNDREVYCPDIVGRGQSDWLKNPKLYGYPQYLADMNTMIACTGTAQVDWVGTSMGGIIGMFLAAQPQSPIRRLVINDVGPFIPRSALKRIARYVSVAISFATMTEFETYIRKVYAPFGITKDDDWHAMAKHSCRQLPDGRIAFAYDPAIAKGLSFILRDVDFWSSYDKITCPTLVLRGAHSDILTEETAHKMTLRGPKATLITIPNVGHAPALMDQAQIEMVSGFLKG